MGNESGKQDEMAEKYQKMKDIIVEKSQKMDGLKLKLEKYRQYALERGLKYVVRFEKDNVGLQREPIKRLLKGNNDFKISLRSIDFTVDFIFDLFQFKIGPFIEHRLNKDRRKTIQSRDLELIYKQYKIQFEEKTPIKGIPLVQTWRLLKILKFNVSENANLYFNYLINKLIMEIGKSGYKRLQSSEDKILSPTHLKKECYVVLETIKIDEAKSSLSFKQRKLGEFV